MINDESVKSLERLHQLKLDGVITQDDFEAAKAKLLHEAPVDGSRLSSATRKSAATKQATWIERVNATLSNFESKHGRIQDGLIIQPKTTRTLRLIIGSTLLLLSLFILPSLMTEYNIFYQVRSLFSLWAVGLTLVTWPLMHRVQPIGETTLVKDSSFYIFGYEINLAVLQLTALACAFMATFYSELDYAWFGCVITILLTPFLFQTRSRKLSIMLALVALVFLFLQGALWDFAYRSEALRDTRHRPLIPIQATLWIVAAIVVMPLLKLPKVNGFGLGQLKGDFKATILGTKVTFAFMSGFLLCCLWGIFEFFQRVNLLY